MVSPVHSAAWATIVGLGLHAVPSSADQASIYDYLVMNVCIDDKGSVTKESPLSCPLDRQRNIRVGDSVYNVNSNYPATKADSDGCEAKGTSRRYSIPLQTPATDESGQNYPLIAAWTDYPPKKLPCAFGEFDARDTVTLLTVAPDFAGLVGAYHHGKWYLTLGEGYRDDRREGVSRFLRTWSFPTKLPDLGAVGWNTFERRTQPFSDDGFSPTDFPASNPNINLTRTIQFWKHIEFEFGSGQVTTKPIQTLLHIPFTQVAETGDAPGETRGSEHFYLTRELGYVTRWETWGRDDNPRAPFDRAQRAYKLGTCSAPATIEGQLTPNLQIGPIIEDQTAGVYKQRITTRDRSGTAKVHWWYMTGCHDFTNVQAAKPHIPSDLVNEKTFGKRFIGQFMAKPDR